MVLGLFLACRIYYLDYSRLFKCTRIFNPSLLVNFEKFQPSSSGEWCFRESFWKTWKMCGTDRIDNRPAPTCRSFRCPIDTPSEPKGSNQSLWNPNRNPTDSGSTNQSINCPVAKTNFISTWGSGRILPRVFDPWIVVSYHNIIIIKKVSHRNRLFESISP